MKHPLLVRLLALVGTGFAFGSLSPAWAQAVLTSAEIYAAHNEVTLNAESAAEGDIMVPHDSLHTGARSRAELIFNEGTLVRTGEGTTFRFPPGQRSFELIDGSTLLMIRPGLGASRITTPEATIVARGTALFVQHDPTKNASVVGVLTDSPAGPVTVTSADGKTSIQLNAGQFVSVANGVIGFIEYFILPVFYDTVDLALGLAPGDETYVSQQSSAVQETLRAVRGESIPPFEAQVAWIGGLCQQGLGTLEQTAQQMPLLQWLWPATQPLEQITAHLLTRDLSVTPLRSLEGLAWVSNYCLAQRPAPPGPQPFPSGPASTPASPAPAAPSASPSPPASQPENPPASPMPDSPPSSMPSPIPDPPL